MSVYGWINKQIEKHKARKINKQMLFVLSEKASLEQFVHFFEKEDPNRLLTMKRLRCYKEDGALHEDENEEIHAFEYFIRKINDSQRDETGQSLLKKKCEFLIEKGFNLQQESADGHTIWQLCVIHHNELMIETLQDHPQGIDIKDKEGDSPLLKASASAYRHLIVPLIKAGANINETDAMGRTIVIRAAMGFINPTISYSCRAIVGYLLAAGADVNKQDHEGKTLIHHLMDFPRLNVEDGLMNLLWEHDLHVHLKDHRGVSMLDLFKKCADNKTIGFGMEISTPSRWREKFYALSERLELERIVHETAASEDSLNAPLNTRGSSTEEVKGLQDNKSRSRRVL